MTGKRIGFRVEKGTFVFDVAFKDGEEGTITLDAGAGGQRVAGGRAERRVDAPEEPAAEDDGSEWQ